MFVTRIHYSVICWNAMQKSFTVTKTDADALVLIDVKQNQFCGEHLSETYVSYEDDHHVHVANIIPFLLWTKTCKLSFYELSS